MGVVGGLGWVVAAAGVPADQIWQTKVGSQGFCLRARKVAPSLGLRDREEEGELLCKGALEPGDLAS